MKDGFIRVAAASPDVVVADCQSNREAMETCIRDMEAQGAKIMVFPELALTGYECRDLFWQQLLQEEAKKQLRILAQDTKDTDALIFVGLPLECAGKLYNVAAALSHGKVLGFVPKSNLPNYNEFYEARIFTAARPDDPDREVEFFGEKVPFGTRLLFTAEGMPHLTVAAELCEDLWVPLPPSIAHTLAGATIVANLSASDEMVGKDSYRRQLVAQHSASCICGYIYATAGEGESTTDLVFGGQNLVAENGTVLAESPRFRNGTIYTDLDVDRIVADRRRMTTFPAQDGEGYRRISFHLEKEDLELCRFIDPRPFIPSDTAKRDARCDEILQIQSMGLKKRLKHTHAQSAVIGISGGLDSTLALLVTVRAFDLLGLSRDKVLAVTMPGFGTTDRTYTNAVTLVKALGATLKEVSIAPAVRQHFADIGQDESVHDVTYENCQARERTQILMDLANQRGGLVIGTGDLSELALGWATYNGDHMSMYAVNASVPKTLVRHLVRYVADTAGEQALTDILLDILDTPVSPELLPPEENGTISQKTEDLVGPYELHDFFLYYMMRFGFSPAKIYRLACIAFHADKAEEGNGADAKGAEETGTVFSKDFILYWMKNFYRRFFAQQFKRSCLPDGPKVGSVAVSPRGDLRMPSDASSRAWMEELEKIGK